MTLKETTAKVMIKGLVSLSHNKMVQDRMIYLSISDLYLSNYSAWYTIRIINLIKQKRKHLNYYGKTKAQYHLDSLRN